MTGSINRVTSNFGNVVSSDPSHPALKGSNTTPFSTMRKTAMPGTNYGQNRLIINNAHSIGKSADFSLFKGIIPAENAS
jgi:hypothetical protein